MVQASKQSMPSIAIVGGGASGIACALRVKQLALKEGLDVAVSIFESGKRIGRSILQSGNGRCNFSNALLDIDSYRNAGFVGQALSHLDASWPYENTANLHDLLCLANGLDSSEYNNAVISWLESMGLLWVMQKDQDGLLYPESNKASTVLETLRQQLDKHDIAYYLETPVVRIEKAQDSNQVIVVAGAEKKIRRRFDYCVIAAGGKIAKTLVEPLGLKFIKQEPVLCPIEVTEKGLKSVNGIRVKATVSIEGKDTIAHGVASKSGAAFKQGEDVQQGSTDRILRQKDYCQTGELLFRDYGLSGIAIFNLSRYAKPGDKLNVELLPEFTQEQLLTFMQNRFELMDSCSVAEFMQGIILPALMSVVFRGKKINYDAPVTASMLPSLAHALKHVSFTVAQNRDDQSCQLHRGGIAVECVDFQTMQIKNNNSVYALGEALDVDAPCGGYNLHWAFSTGLIAAASLMEAVSADSVEHS